jgi:hypothetical protein
MRCALTPQNEAVMVVRNIAGPLRLRKKIK